MAEVLEPEGRVLSSFEFEDQILGREKEGTSLSEGQSKRAGGTRERRTVEDEGKGSAGESDEPQESERPGGSELGEHNLTEEREDGSAGTIKERASENSVCER